MGCLFAMFAGLFPRLCLFIVWIARPAFVDAAFDTFLLPLLGLGFLPVATLIYVLLNTPGVGLTGWGWFWVIPSPGYSTSATGGPATPSGGRSRACAARELPERRTGLPGRKTRIPALPRTRNRSRINRGRYLAGPPPTSSTPTRYSATPSSPSCPWGWA
jgi:hypothetical protein